MTNKSLTAVLADAIGKTEREINEELTEFQVGPPWHGTIEEIDEE